MDGRILEENTAPQHRRHLAEKTFMLGQSGRAQKGDHSKMQGPLRVARARGPDATYRRTCVGRLSPLPPVGCGRGARGTHAPNGGDLSPRRITDAVKLRAPAAVKLQVRSTGIEESLTPRSTSEPLAVGSVAPSIAEAKSAQLR